MSSLAEAVRRRRSRPGAGAAFGSILVHAAVVAAVLIVSASAPDFEQFISYDIELVSMPGPDLGDLVVEAPAPSPSPEAPPPEPQPVVKEPEPEPDPEPKPETKAPPSPTPPRPTQPRANPSDGPATGPESSETINIRMAGLRRDYPAYYDNIILQITRCFRWQGSGSPETEVYFVINADGKVPDLRFLRRSGNTSFDYSALGAIECAGQGGRFGGLPDDLPFDRLPIRFSFRPSGAGFR